jgi:hypothetical protein
MRRWTYSFSLARGYTWGYTTRNNQTARRESFMAKKSRETAELKLRVSEQVRQGIEVAAKFNNRSLNAEINERLERSLSGLFEEVLMLAYPSEAPSLIGAYRHGMLRLKKKDIEHIKQCLNRWADQVHTALEG